MAELKLDIPTGLVCPEGDIFTLPTKAELVNALNDIVSIPAKVRAQFLEHKAEKEAEIRDLWAKLNDPNLTKEEKDAIIAEINGLEAELYPALAIIEEEIEAIVEDFEKFREKIEKLLDPYWRKGKVRNFQQEANEAITKLLAEFHLYIPTKIAEFISKFVPFNYNITIMGISIDVVRLVTDPNYKKQLEEQLMGFEFLEQINEKYERITEIKQELAKLKDDPLYMTAEEELALLQEMEQLYADITGLESAREKFVDRLFKILPESCRQFDGDYGTLDIEAKGQQVFKCIQKEVKEWIQNWHVKAFEKLIDLFDEIWELLGLPDLPFSELIDILTLDVNDLVQKAIEYIKEEFDKTKLGIMKKINDIDKLLEEEPYKSDVAAREILLEARKELEDELLGELRAFQEKIRDAILELQIFGYDVRKIIGDKIESTTQSLEEEIADFILALEDFKMNWHKKILFEWVKVIKKFLDKIGLGKIFDPLFLTFCDILKLIGFLPLQISVAVPSIAGIVSGSNYKPSVQIKSSGKEELDEFSFETDGIQDTFAIDGSGSNKYVFMDGIRQDPSTYSVSGNNIVFNTPPAAGQFVAAFGDDREFASSGQTNFDAQGQTLTIGGVKVFINRVLQTGDQLQTEDGFDLVLEDDTKMLTEDPYVVDTVNQRVTFINSPNNGLVFIEVA